MSYTSISHNSQDKILIEGQESRCKLLEQELNLCIAAGQRAEDAHVKEIEKLEEQTNKYAKEQRALINRFQQNDIVEDTIKDLYVQMKIRINEEDPTIEQIEKEKEDLKNENILNVLGALHANLEHLWQFKMDAERDMKNLRSKRELECIKKIGDLKNETQRLAVLLEKERSQNATLRAELQEVITAKEELKTISVALAYDMEEKYKTLIEELRKSDIEKQKLGDLLRLSQKEGKRRDSLILQLQRLKDKNSCLASMHEREINRIRCLHQKEISEIRKADMHMLDVRQDRDKLKLENEELRKNVKSLKMNCKTKMIQQLEAKVANLQKKLKHQTAQSNTAETFLAPEQNGKSSKPRPHSAVPQRVVRFEDEEHCKIWMKDDIDGIRNNVLETLENVKSRMEVNPFEEDLNWTRHLHICK